MPFLPGWQKFDLVKVWGTQCNQVLGEIVSGLS